VVCAGSDRIFSGVNIIVCVSAIHNEEDNPTLNIILSVYAIQGCLKYTLAIQVVDVNANYAAIYSMHGMELESINCIE